MWRVFSPLVFILFLHYQKDSKKDFVVDTGMSLSTLHLVSLENGPDLHQNILFSKIRDVEVSDCLLYLHACSGIAAIISVLLSQCLRLHKYSSSVLTGHHSTQRHLSQDSLAISLS